MAFFIQDLKAQKAQKAPIKNYDSKICIRAFWELFKLFELLPFFYMRPPDGRQNNQKKFHQQKK
jgi:hypothetical protein